MLRRLIFIIVRILLGNKTVWVYFAICQSIRYNECIFRLCWSEKILLCYESIMSKSQVYHCRDTAICSTSVKTKRQTFGENNRTDEETMYYNIVKIIIQSVIGIGNNLIVLCASCEQKVPVIYPSHLNKASVFSQ